MNEDARHEQLTRALHNIFGALEVIIGQQERILAVMEHRQPDPDLLPKEQKKEVPQ